MLLLCAHSAYTTEYMLSTNLSTDTLRQVEEISQPTHYRHAQCNMMYCPKFYAKDLTLHVYAAPGTPSFFPLTLFHSNKNEMQKAIPAHAMDNIYAWVTATS